MTTSEEEIDEAIKRLGLTNDGRMLRLRLQRVIDSLSPSSDSGALQRHEGRRTLAHDLRALVDQGLAQAELKSAGTRFDPEQPVVIVPRGAGERAAERSRRRVSEYPAGET